MKTNKKWEFVHSFWGRGSGVVPTLGKWSVIGETGNFHIIGPNGWEYSESYKFEHEAMSVVESKYKEDNREPIPKNPSSKTKFR